MTLFDGLPEPAASLIDAFLNPAAVPPPVSSLPPFLFASRREYYESGGSAVIEWPMAPLIWNDTDEECDEDDSKSDATVWSEVNSLDNWPRADRHFWMGKGACFFVRTLESWHRPPMHHRSWR